MLCSGRHQRLHLTSSPSPHTTAAAVFLINIYECCARRVSGVVLDARYDSRRRARSDARRKISVDGCGGRSSKLG